MKGKSGAWAASQENLRYADIVESSVKASGKLYRDGLGTVSYTHLTLPTITEV